MKRIIRLLPIIAFISGAPFVAIADPAPEERPMLFQDRAEIDMFDMLGRPVIQEELEISVSQYEQYMQAIKTDGNDPYHKMSRDEQSKHWREWVDRKNKAAEKILEPEQFHRLQQIQLQMRGVVMFQHADIVKKMELTEEQHDEIYAALTELQGRIFSHLPVRDKKGVVHDNFVKERAEDHRVANEKVRAILTEEQKDKWTEMLGPEFKKQIWTQKPIYVDE